MLGRCIGRNADGCFVSSAVDHPDRPLLIAVNASTVSTVHRFALHQHIRAPSSRSRSIQSASVLLHFVIFHMCRIQGRAMIFDSPPPDGGVTGRVCKKPPARIALGFPHTFACMATDRNRNFCRGVGLLMSSPARNGVLDGLLVGSRCMMRLVFDHLSRSLRGITSSHTRSKLGIFCVTLSFR